MYLAVMFVGWVGWYVVEERRSFLSNTVKTSQDRHGQPYSSSVEGGLCREARRGVPNHHGAAPRQVGAADAADAAAAATVSAIAEVEVVQEIVAAADGVGPLLRWREREEEGYSEGSGGTHGWPHGVSTKLVILTRTGRYF